MRDLLDGSEHGLLCDDVLRVELDRIESLLVVANRVLLQRPCEVALVLDVVRDLVELGRGLGDLEDLAGEEIVNFVARGSATGPSKFAFRYWSVGSDGLRLSMTNLTDLPMVTPPLPVKAMASNCPAVTSVSEAKPISPSHTGATSAQQSPNSTHKSSHQHAPAD
ncbi:MAG: hypothetical protein JKY37_01845 [Nannocystaceae bacterium]|nr:hypothetical protein [Nannocystaceae bacterium]